MVTIVSPLFTTNETDSLKRILEYLADEEAEYADLAPEKRPGHIFHSVLILRASKLIAVDQFPLGRICYTFGATAALDLAQQEPWEFLCRHSSGDWGDVCSADWQENIFSLEKGYRLLSSYRTAKGERLWIITEGDRSVTTILLPDEY